MATAEQILSATLSTDSAEPANHFTVSEDWRTVSIPDGQEVLGVYNDKDVRRIWFDAPKECDGTDMSGFDVYVHYVNALGEGDAYQADDLSDNGDGTMTFSWTVGRHAFAAAGDVTIALCARATDASHEVDKEFNTTTFAMPVLDGIQTSAESVSGETDAFEQMKAQWHAEMEAAVSDALAECREATSAAWSAAYGQSIWTIVDGRLGVIVQEGQA